MIACRRFNPPSRICPGQHCLAVISVRATAGCRILTATSPQRGHLSNFRSATFILVRTEESKLYLFVAIDRTCKFAYAELHAKSDRQVATAFLCHLITAVPYKIHTILTDNGSQFCQVAADPAPDAG